MYAPVLKKLVEKEDTYIERCLPVAGNILVKETDVVKPFDRLGECVFSQKQTWYPKTLKPFKYKKTNQFYYTGSVLGKIGKKSVSTPFNGYLSKNDDKTFTLKAADDKYTLLSGVWGVVHKVVENRSVLIETKTKDLLLAACTPINTSGELVVFPNPVEILEKYYLESFSKSNAGKIVYVGQHADLEVVKRAEEMSAAAILAGSADRQTFNYAKSNKLALGIISGFGRPETPDQVYSLLSAIAYRYVFLNGEKNTLRIPHSATDAPVDSKSKGTRRKTTVKVIKEVKKGVDIVCLQAPNFGKIGTVDSVSGSSIFVRFSSGKGLTEVKLPNFFIIE